MKSISPLIIVILILVLISSCKSLLYPSYIREEFSGFYQSGTNKDLRSLINIDGYYIVNEKNRGLTLSFFFSKSGIFNYQTSLDKTNGIETGYYSVYCGTYIQHNDTIKTTYMSHPTFNGGFTAYKTDFLVINRNTLKILCKRAFHESSRYKECLDEEYFSLATFVPLDTLPEPKCWLLEEDWFYKSIFNRNPRTNW